MPKKLYLFLLISLISTLSYSQEEHDEVGWKNTLVFHSQDAEIRFGGRILYDLGYFALDDEMAVAFSDQVKFGSKFRQVRFYSAGILYSQVKYKLQMDFQGGKVSFFDVYMDVPNIPIIGDFRVGHFVEPYRLEVLESAKYMTFMERGFNSAYSPKWRSGFMIKNKAWGGLLNWQLAYMFNSDKQSANSLIPDDAGGNITGRITSTLINDESNRRFLHLGLSYSHRIPEAHTYQLSTGAEIKISKQFLSTGIIENVNHINILNTELAFVNGPFSFQSEYSFANINQTDGCINCQMPSWYAFISYFVTGESRNFKGSYSTFGRLKPKKNFGEGKGALELAIRYNTIQLPIFDGENTNARMSGITLGANWYLNPAAKVVLNYMIVNDHSIGKANITGLRFQVDF